MSTSSSKRWHMSESLSSATGIDVVQKRKGNEGKRDGVVGRHTQQYAPSKNPVGSSSILRTDVKSMSKVHIHVCERSRNSNVYCIVVHSLKELVDPFQTKLFTTLDRNMSTMIVH